MAIKTITPGWKKKYAAVIFLRDIVCYGLALSGVAFLIFRGIAQSSYNWQWYRVSQFFYTWDDNGFVAGPLLRGLGMTLYIAVISLALSFVFGLAGTIAGMGKSRVGRFFSRVYVETIRNTPLVVQLFVMYFIIAPVFGLGQVPSAVLALSLFEGAYLAEIFRAGIGAVPKGQWEAGFSLGFSRAATFLHVVLPQAFSHVLPPLTGELVNLVKNTALVSIIAVTDLSMQGQVIIADTFLSLEIWLVVAAVYLVLTLSLAFLTARLERRTQRRT